MFDFVGKLFGSDKAASKLVDNISSGLDKIHYSKQEQAEDELKSREKAADLLIDWLKSTQGSNLARRTIALTVTAIWSLQYTVSMIFLGIIPWVSDAGLILSLQNSAESLRMSGGQIDGAMMLVLGFYFAAPHVGAIVSTAMDKFSNKNNTKEK